MMDLPPAACLYSIYANMHNRSKLQTDVVQNHTQEVFFFCHPVICVHILAYLQNTSLIETRYLGVEDKQPQSTTLVLGDGTILLYYIELIYEQLSLPTFRDDDANSPDYHLWTSDSYWQYQLIMRHRNGVKGREAVNFHHVVCSRRWCVRHSECYLSYSPSKGKAKGHIITPLGITLNQDFPIWWYILWTAVLVAASNQWSIINYAELF